MALQTIVRPHDLNVILKGIKCISPRICVTESLGTVAKVRKKKKFYLTNRVPVKGKGKAYNDTLNNFVGVMGIRPLTHMIIIHF